MKTNFSLIQHHKWRLSEIENLIVWERLVYVSLLQQYLKDEKERIRLEQQTGRR